MITSSARPFVPDVAVLVLARGVLGVEPLAAEHLVGCLRPVPVAERIVRVRAGAQADLAALALGDRTLVLVQDLDVPAGHRLAHRALADLHERVVPDERIRLRQPVVVEHRHAVLLPEPANRLRIQGLAGRADPPELLRIPRPGILDRHHRPHRRRRREDVRHLVAAEEVELPVRIEAGLAPVYALHRAEPPWSQERRDPRCPRPFAHAVEPLAVGDLMAVDELLVAEDVAVGMDDALREPGRSGRVVELRGILGRGVAGNGLGRGPCERVGLQDEHPATRVGEARPLSASVTTSFAPESERRWRIESSP
jgi:hypothetical protein